VKSLQIIVELSSEDETATLVALDSVKDTMTGGRCAGRTVVSVSRTGSQFDATTVPRDRMSIDHGGARQSKRDA